MAIMIPPEIPDDAPMSEKEIFETLKPIAQSRNWVVLHSILIDSRKIDFVIFIPDICSVICIKVVQDNNLEAVLVNVKEDMEALKERFKTSYFGNHSSLLLGYNIVSVDDTSDDIGLKLTNCADEICSDEVRKIISNWEDSDNIEKYQKAQLMLNELRTELVSTGETITTIATIFHDNLETHRPQLLRLANDQLEVLQLVGCQSPSSISTESDNQIQSSEPVKDQPRVVVDGAAGTGKTVLAIEIARQRCEAGETVGLLCSNPYLSQRFEKWAETLPSDNGGKVIVGTPAKLPFWAFRENDRLTSKHQQRLDDSKLGNSTDLEGSPKSTDLEGSLKFGYLDKGWQQFIDATIEDLKTLEQEQVFDYLIVDEAQNLCDKMFLDLQDALLKHGLENGRWIMFGDFENQEIVSPEINPDWTMLANYFENQEIVSSEIDINWKEVQKEVLRKIGIKYATLETNCRNTHEIADKTFKLVKIKSPTMSGVYGPHVQIKYFGTQEKLEGILDNLIKDWENRRFQSRQIILLSSGTGDEFNTSRNYSGWKLLNIAEETSHKTGNTLRYSDIYDFQGLESDLVILVLPQTEDNVELADSFTLPREKHLRRVLYTGMSRARVMLVIVADQRWKETLELREFLIDKRITLQKT